MRCGPLLHAITGYQMRSNTDIQARFSLKVVKRIEIPSVPNPDAIALTRQIKQL
jgi:hypothetical protein